ncbi:WD40-repeat-containing domain protein [Lenzites betulinus]|nr:WD40-repeat-containing domain protein [Lenzites betulinus]
MSSGWEYSEYALLPSAPGHSSPITAVAISPKGTLIAVATSGGDVNIWELAGQKIIYAFHGGVTILSLKWDPSEKDQLICGMDDGYLASLSFLDNKIHVSGFVGHSSPVNCIDINDLQVASGAANEVRVWQWYTYGLTYPWKLLVELPYPPRTGQRLDDNQRVVTVTSLQWLSSGKQLLVAYLYHGIWYVLCAHTVCPTTLIARVDVAEDARRMAVSNLLTGFDLYSTSSGKLVRALGHDVGAKRATPVRFIESGSALVGGTTMGELMIWDTTTGRKLQTLIYHGKYTPCDNDNRMFSLVLQIIGLFSRLMYVPLNRLLHVRFLTSGI